MTQAQKIRKQLRAEAYIYAMYSVRDRYPKLFARLFAARQSENPSKTYNLNYMGALADLRRRYSGLHRRFYDEQLALRGVA